MRDRGSRHSDVLLLRVVCFLLLVVLAQGAAPTTAEAQGAGVTPLRALTEALRDSSAGGDYGEMDAWAEVNSEGYSGGFVERWLADDTLAREGEARARFEVEFAAEVSDLMGDQPRMGSLFREAAAQLASIQGLYRLGAVLELGQTGCSRALGIIATHGTATVTNVADWEMLLTAIRRGMVAEEMASLEQRLTDLAGMLDAAQGRRLSYAEANRLYHYYLDARSRGEHIGALAQATFPETDFWSQLKRVVLSAVGAGAASSFERSAKSVYRAKKAASVQRAARAAKAAGVVAELTTLEGLVSAVLDAKPLWAYYEDAATHDHYVPLIEMTWRAWLGDVRGEPRPVPQGTRGFMDEDAAMVPLRPIAEWLGARVDYVPSLNAARVARGRQRVFVTPAGDQPMTPSAATAQGVLRGGTTYVPVRFVSTQLGADVKWDAQTGTVRIFDAGRSAEIPVREAALPEDTEARQALDIVIQALLAFERDSRLFPESLGDLLLARPPAYVSVYASDMGRSVSWNGPYLLGGSLPENPFTGGRREGRDWEYFRSGPPNAVLTMPYAPDGQRYAYWASWGFTDAGPVSEDDEWVVKGGPGTEYYSRDGRRTEWRRGPGNP